MHISYASWFSRYITWCLCCPYGVTECDGIQRNDMISHSVFGIMEISFWFTVYGIIMMWFFVVIDSILLRWFKNVLLCNCKHCFYSVLTHSIRSLSDHLVISLGYLVTWLPGYLVTWLLFTNGYLCSLAYLVTCTWASVVSRDCMRAQYHLFCPQNHLRSTYFRKNFLSST